MFAIGYHADFTGSQRSLLALVQALRDRDVRPLVVFPGEGRCTAAFRDAGVRVEVLLAPPPLDQFGGVLPASPFPDKVALASVHLPRYARRFAALLAREQADIAHFNDIRVLLLAGGGAVLRRTPRVWHVRGDGSNLGIAWSAGAALAGRMICVADAVRGVAPAWARSRCRTVYNGIEDAPDAPEPRTRSALLATVPAGLVEREGDLLLVMVASLVPFKGAHHLVDAALDLERRAPDLAARLVIVHVGDAPDPAYRAHVLERARHLAHVRFRLAGWDERPLDWMTAAEAVVLPTVHREVLRLGQQDLDVHGSEGFPRTVLEAMVCGRPVVTTRVMGMPEQVVDGVTGVLCSPSDPAALAAGLERVLSMTPAARAAMGVAARDRVQARFSVDAMVTGTLGVYRELVGAR